MQTNFHDDSSDDRLSAARNAAATAARRVHEQQEQNGEKVRSHGRCGERSRRARYTRCIGRPITV